MLLTEFFVSNQILVDATGHSRDGAVPVSLDGSCLKRNGRPHPSVRPVRHPVKDRFTSTMQVVIVRALQPEGPDPKGLNPTNSNTNDYKSNKTTLAIFGGISADPLP